MASRHPLEVAGSSSDSAPAARAAGAPPAASRAAGPPWRTVSAAVTETNEVGVEQRRVHVERNATDVSERTQRLVLAVVHDHAAVKVARPIGSQQGLELAAPGTVGESTRDQDRLLLARHPGSFQFVQHGGQRVPAWILGHTRQRKRRRLDHHGDPAPGCCQQLERWAREREAERLADRRTDVGDRVEWRRRPEEHRVGRRVEHRQAGAGEKRQAWHERCQPTWDTAPGAEAVGPRRALARPRPARWRSR